MKKIRVSLLAAGLVGLVVLSGCTGGPAPVSTGTPSASATSAATATPTPTPTPTPVAPAATAIVISGYSITVLAAGSTVLADIPFTTDGPTAVAQLSLALNANPVTTDVAAGTCSRVGQRFAWGDFIIVGAGDITKSPDSLFSAHALGATASPGVAVYGPGHVQVGMSEADVLAAIPTAVPSGGIAALETVSGGGTPNEIGVVGYLDGGSLKSIGSQLYLFGDC
jgi:hypothetical protein